jgi:6-pyruvoyltetrahydropterin/6-carboxytetrahydropterin synthase
MFEIGINAEFEASHALRGDFGPASQPHAHQYRVEVSAAGPDLQPDGTLFDITRLQDALRRVLGPLQGSNLNDVAALVEPNPTAEVVARYIFEQIAPAVAGYTLTVRVWESPEAYASYARAAS